jgi:hypothetical protein
VNKRRDSDILIDVLQRAREAGPHEIPRGVTGDVEAVSMAADLERAKMIRGELVRDGDEYWFRLFGITISGREYLEQLISRRDSKKLSTRAKTFAWAAAGVFGTLLVGAIKAWIESLFGH